MDFMQLILITILAIFLFLLHNHGINGDRGGRLFFKFLCYENLGHLDIKGEVCDSVPSVNCDPYFAICISNHYIHGEIIKENCPIFYMKTEPYSNKDRVCHTNEDNRESLSKEFIKELAFPIPKVFHVAITVTDYDLWKDHQSIARFSAEFLESPSPNYSTIIYKEIKMFRVDYRYSNPKVRLTIAMALQCEVNLYGKHCITFCQESSTLKCSRDGKSICKEGWKGETCTLKDPCTFQKCIKGAMCIDVNHQAKCIYKGKIEPQNYNNYKPCQKNPCKNGGKCLRINSIPVKFSCHCNLPFYGVFCESKIDLCKSEPCHNKAKCEYRRNNTRHCICLNGYFGRLCDHTYKNSTIIYPNNSWTNPLINQKSNRLHINKFTMSNSMWILTILFGICLFGFLSFIVLFLIKIKNRKEHHFSKNNKNQRKSIDDKMEKFNLVSSNYSVIQPKENEYDLIKDEETYNCINDLQDDYLIPIISPGIKNTFLGVDNTDCHDLTMRKDAIETLVEETEKKTDSYYLPALPTRNIKKKINIRKILHSPW